MFDKEVAEEVINEAESSTEEVSSVEETESVEESEPQEYVPVGKYRVMDEEREFDDWIKQSIKNAEHEKRVKELYERAEGLEYVKNDRQRLREEMKAYQESLQEYDEVKQDLRRAGHFLKSGDIGGFLQEYGLTEDQVAEYIVRKEQLKQDPHAYSNFLQQEHALRNEWHQRQQYEAEAAYIEEENRRLDAMEVQLRAQDLDHELSRPGFREQVQAFDQRMGEHGAFRRHVIEYGQAKWFSDNIDLPPAEAIKHVATLAGFDFGQKGNRSSNNQRVFSNNQSNSGQRATIPNISGSQNSPVRSVPKSIDDLRKIHQRLST